MTSRHPAPSQTLVRVVAPHFVAGFVMQEDQCVAAAPILRRTVMGKSADVIRGLLVAKGWRASIVALSLMLLLLGGCAGTASLIDAKPVVELIGAAVPAVLAADCDKPVVLPNGAMSAGAVERAMSKDRTALTVCGLMHKASIEYYAERDRGLSHRR